MKSNILSKIGIDPGILLIVIIILLIVMIVLYVRVNIKYNRLKNSYTLFMRGQDGKTLEQSFTQKFQELKATINMVKQNRQDIKKIYRKIDNDYQKVGIVKYDAFNEMGGKLSFALTLLDGNNNGWIINAMHSREGCYTYVKEIVKGQSYIELAEEEAESLEHAMYKEMYEMNPEDAKKNGNN
ncbi:MAG: DUF4446 family protein [Lachnospiraceae bacterium]